MMQLLITSANWRYRGRYRMLWDTYLGSYTEFGWLCNQDYHNWQRKSAMLYPGLNDKHPLGKWLEEGCLLSNTPEPINLIMFDLLDAEGIHQSALHTHGAARLSGLMPMLGNNYAPPLDPPLTTCVQHWQRLLHMHYLRTSRYPKCLCGMPFDSTR